MSKVRADRYTNRADDGAPTFSQGVNVVGSGVSIGIGASVYSPSTNELVLGTNSTERVRIANDGNVGIGTDNPLRQLQLHSDAAETVALQITNQGTGATDDNSGFTLKIGSVGQVNLDQRTPGQDIIVYTNGVERMRYGSVGVCTFVKDLHISDGNLVVANGKGIDFSATADGTGSNQDELFDDYETGNWTPVIKSGPTDVVTYTGGQQYFRYIKVGRLVTLFFSLNNVTTAGNTGAQCLISGLPFAADAGNTNNRFISGDVMFYNTGLTLSDWPVYAHHASGDTTINFYEKASAGSNYNSVNVNTVGSGTYFFFSLQYYTAS